MKRTGLIALLLATVVGISGCTAATSAQDEATVDTSATTAPEQTQPEAEAPSDADETAQKPEADEPKADESGADEPEAGAKADPVSPIYQDSYKSIFLIDAAQVAAISGVKVTTDSVGKVVGELKSASAWKGEKAMAEHADLIAKAVARETHSTTRAVTAVAHDDNARVKVVVVHNGHKNIAHIERGHHDS